MFRWRSQQNLPVIDLSRLSRQKFYRPLLPAVQAPVVQKVDNAIHYTNHYPLDSAIGFRYTYVLDSDLSSG